MGLNPPAGDRQFELLHNDNQKKTPPPINVEPKLLLDTTRMGIGRKVKSVTSIGDSPSSLNSGLVLLFSLFFL